MRVPDLITHSPVFLVVEDEGRDRMAGTGFFVSWPSEGLPGHTHGYLVTARHCVEQAKRYGSMYVRINSRVVSGSPKVGDYTEAELAKQAADAELIEIEAPAKWHFHDDPVNDVAVLPMTPPVAKFMFLVASEESFATDEVVTRESIGVGDDLLVVGLFTSHHGRTMNRPIVRAGIIAAMPEEPVEDQYSGEFFDAYLAEVRSVGGLSGSPVWLVISPGRIAPGQEGREHRLHFYLLGLIRGHWKKDEDWLSDFGDTEMESLNTGIAIVTPIQRALDIIQSKELKKQRKDIDRAETARLQEGQQGNPS
jgi:hypothetical protein